MAAVLLNHLKPLLRCRPLLLNILHGPHRVGVEDRLILPRKRTLLLVFRYLLHHFSPFFCYVRIISYFCIVEGDSWGVFRATGSTSNKTAGGRISTKMARSTCEGGIFFAYILLIQPLIRRFQCRVLCGRHFIRLSTNSVAAFNI